MRYYCGPKSSFCKRFTTDWSKSRKKVLANVVIDSLVYNTTIDKMNSSISNWRVVLIYWAMGRSQQSDVYQAPLTTSFSFLMPHHLRLANVSKLTIRSRLDSLRPSPTTFVQQIRWNSLGHCHFFLFVHTPSFSARGLLTARWEIAFFFSSASVSSCINENVRSWHWRRVKPWGLYLLRLWLERLHENDISAEAIWVELFMIAMKKFSLNIISTMEWMTNRCMNSK